MSKFFLRFNPKYRHRKDRYAKQLFYTIDVIQKLTGVNLLIRELSHGRKAKNKRIENLEPYYRVGQIYHNQSLTATSELEAELLSFDTSIESKSDDLMDGVAYILQYVVNRWFDEVTDIIVATCWD
ncbi:MAG: hypothetical protein ACTTJC_01620 [Campylobacter sp.]